MNRTSRLSTIVFAIVLISGAFHSSHSQQVGRRVGPQFPFLVSSARLTGMADASIAVVDDFSGFGSNPATLGMMKKSVVDYTNQRVKKGITFEHIGIAYKATPDEAVAFDAEVLHYGGIDFYTKNEVRDLGFEARAGITYGRVLSEGLSAGLSLQALTSTTGTTSVWAFATDIGFTYAPGRYIRYALSLKGLGSDYDVPGGILLADTYSKRLAKVLSIGLAFDYPYDDKEKRLVIAFQNDKVLGEKTLLYRFGIEYTPFYAGILQPSIRGGLVVRGLDVEPRFGLGIQYSQFGVDYGYRYSKREFQPSHVFTFSVDW
ncbi:MAG: hypothetical protein HY961_06885 [Ignavibacteriae bacterium]|nr:hypothetical protein [Ignavibacteriota bacterium]